MFKSFCFYLYIVLIVFILGLDGLGDGFVGGEDCELGFGVFGFILVVFFLEEVCDKYYYFWWFSI